MSRVSVIIPSRLSSSRLPNKPLAMIGQKTMIEHVVEQALKTKHEVIVACDDMLIASAVSKTEATVVMTDKTCRSGTDRILAVMEKLQWSDEHIIINCQGDEPLMPPENMMQLVEVLQQNPAQGMASLYVTVDANDETVIDPNHVKVVCDHHDKALYFSRSPIPYYREAPQSDEKIKIHLGLYAYRVGFLRQWQQWDVAPIEKAESLEQLRALWHGHSIQMVEADIIPPMGGVDTPEDLMRAQEILKTL